MANSNDSAYTVLYLHVIRHVLRLNVLRTFFALLSYRKGNGSEPVPSILLGNAQCLGDLSNWHIRYKAVQKPKEIDISIFIAFVTRIGETQ
ncbi:hypothetical protein NPIL_502301 [Nephila pilipes]|uniref:Uncharacterized protein n=1 Tax=Nephila pilipes TaxID=299642 RepID=A0A8X6QEI3_NEPPI|nr:hypothetical protein NPIL_502301 [Nephila pilipes]